MKTYLYGSLIAVSAFLFVTTTTIAAKDEVKNPFDLVWEAIADIREDITNITLTPGPQGEKGDNGDTGETGPQGPSGPQGEVGPMGPQGEQGKQGEPGTDGKDGAHGQNLIVKDLNGNEIGFLLGYIRPSESPLSFYYQVWLSSENVIALYNPMHEGAQVTQELVRQVYYTESGCSGDKYVIERYPQELAINVQGESYVVSQEYTPVSAKSYWRPGGNCQSFSPITAYYKLSEVDTRITSPLTVVTE